jgi:branched-chain amino acid aminotransferase
VTRDSALTLLREWGITVSERQIEVGEVIAAARSGRLSEAWGSGTAAVISPVGELSYRGERVLIHGGRIGELTQRLYQSIMDIQYARVRDTRGWTLEE